ncbi:OPT family oligopeptide transporter [Bovifimicola ammoniilytica]|uniref:OPT family oligopeptide transporter n=1 Tax=Bovifimicola ammoniilytica TaxID=2981720 RepID=UPI0011C9FFD7|nr:oligopeptide transporter, OPT family [Bovifimicola ammoniilytica]MCU6752962.1 oligopeptide transporter, OPT family [Bovifimicola ammoniilytica]
MEDNKEFKPYIPADKVMSELSITSVILGIILAVIFGGANAYLGLRVGMTVSASIPAAVVSMGIIRIILKRNSILENNIVQTIGSAGESVAAGAIFTLPVLFMWFNEGKADYPKYAEITLICGAASILGILFMIPLRKVLIVKEHYKLPYPEGTACAKVLMAGENNKSDANLVFAGLGIAAIYKFMADGLKLFSSEVHYDIKRLKGAAIGIDILPALLSVGYICGPKIAGYMFAGGLISWIGLMPLINMFGDNIIMFPGDKAINLMSSGELWSNYIRYIGAGAVATAGIISLVKTLPIIFSSFSKTLRRKGENEENVTRLNKNIDNKLIWTGIVVIVLFLWLSPIFPINFPGAILIVIFGFFFATVSSRMVGLVGSSNNPVSGMAIATLIITGVILSSSGIKTNNALTGTIVVGSVICIVAAISGDTSQDLKTGYILGATPMKQQIGEIIGVVASSLAISGVLYLLNNAWGFGSSELPAPQATLMKIVVEGVMEGNLPWNLIMIGAAVAIAVEIMGVPALPFAVGMYLPIYLSAGIMLGGVVRFLIDKFADKVSEKGILVSSGMIAGEGLVGIILAILEVV